MVYDGFYLNLIFLVDLYGDNVTVPPHLFQCLERNNYTLYNSWVLIIVLTTCIFYFTDLVTAVITDFIKLSKLLENNLNHNQL